MNDNLVIGLDSSTTSTKAIVFDKNGKILAQASSPIQLFSPRQNYYEQDPEGWWKSAKIVLLKVTQQIDPKRIKALSISNQRETFVVLDKTNKTIRPAIIWLDERCKSEVQPFANQIGKTKIHKITGKPVDFAPVVYRLAWMKKFEKSLYRKISMVCDVQSWLVWKLTNEFKTSWASADPLGLFDIKNKRWSDLIQQNLDLSEKQLPEVFPSGTIFSKISIEASKATGLNKETLVISGGGDGQAAGLGSAAISTERAYLNLGTAVVAGIYGKTYKTSKAYRTMNACDGTGFYFESSLRTGTFAIDWFVKNILNVNPIKQPNIYNQLEKEAKVISLGSDGLFFLPYLSGVMNPYWDVDAKGMFIGLSTFHMRGHIYKAILEGIAFEQLFAIESIEKSIKSKVDELVVIGGGSKSNFWIQLIADITGKNVVINKSSEASCLGAGIIAAVGIGLHSTFESASLKMTEVQKVIKPNSNNHNLYLEKYLVYKKIYPANKKFNGQ